MPRPRRPRRRLPRPPARLLPPPHPSRRIPRWSRDGCSARPIAARRWARGAAASSRSDLAPPEATGSIPPAPASKPANPAVVEGWVLRKAYRGAALVEGRYGIIEIEPGDHLPGVGRGEESKRQDGRWVVVTPRGLILGVQ